MGEEIEPRKLFVGGLSWNTTNESLRDYFSKYGEVTDCVVMMNSEGKPRGFGFVTFVDRETAELAIKPPNKHVLDSKTIDPKPATVKGSGKFKLFAGGLAPTTTSETLLAHFSAIEGVKVVSAEIKKNPEGKSKGFGFIDVDSEESIKNILNENGSNKRYEIDGKSVEVKIAFPQEKSDSRTKLGSSVPSQMMFSQGYYPTPGMNSYERTGQFPSGSSYPQYNYTADSYSGFSNPQSVYGYGQYSTAARGYSGQQMGSYPSNTSYNQTSTNFPATESSYSSGMMSYGNYHQQQQSYNYGDQAGGGASPSYSRAGMNAQNRTSSAGSHGYTNYGTR